MITIDRHVAGAEVYATTSWQYRGETLCLAVGLGREQCSELGEEAYKRAQAALPLWWVIPTEWEVKEQYERLVRARLLFLFRHRLSEWRAQGCPVPEPLPV